MIYQGFIERVFSDGSCEVRLTDEHGKSTFADVASYELEQSGVRAEPDRRFTMETIYHPFPRPSWLARWFRRKA